MTPFTPRPTSPIRLDTFGGVFVLLAISLTLTAAELSRGANSTWPQPYTVQRDDAAGVLTLRTPYYTVEHDLRKGGAIRRITLTHGRAANLLARPVETRVRVDQGAPHTDVNDPAPQVSHRRDGLTEIVTIDSALNGPQRDRLAARVRSTYTYHWGYVRIRREFLPPAEGIRVLELCPLATMLVPSLSAYGYREGITEEEGAQPFAFGSNRWGKMRRGEPSDQPLRTPFVPRSMMFVDPGVEGLEWFVSSDLAQWDLQLTGRRGQGMCTLELREDPDGLALAIAPYASTNVPVTLTNRCTFDFYLAVPLLEGHALKPWVHTSFNRNRGEWVSTETIERWAEQGYQTVHCHNDGDYYDDGLFWRDGSYPPYPDMDRFDRVLQDCRRVGIRTATYFSNKELHPSTKEFQEHGQEWARKNRAGRLQHNFYRPQSEFGAQMCLRSGWLEFLKSSIDRVLQNHALDGVYYDWNVALLCCNPLHEGKTANAPAHGHWDVDELLNLMEWTRQRVGPRGLVIIHNTTTPMFALENFADKIVATEWGYGKWTDRAPDLRELPLEWSLAGARARGVISYGTIDSSAPRRLHKLFALEAFLGGVTPWPASPETFELLPVLEPIGDLETCRFADWRNSAVTLSTNRCASAVYSRAGEAYVFVANLDAAPQDVTCVLHPERLPYPLAAPRTATLLKTAGATDRGSADSGDVRLDIPHLVGPGARFTVPADGAVLIRVR